MPIHEYTQSRRVILITVGNLLELNAQNWKYNRPADDIRVQEIKKYLNQEDAYILQPLVSEPAEI